MILYVFILYKFAVIQLYCPNPSNILSPPTLRLEAEDFSAFGLKIYLVTERSDIVKITFKNTLGLVVVTTFFLSIGACQYKSDPNNIQQYKTDYVGDNSKVIAIVKNQEYSGYSVDHVEIQSETEPYGIKVYLKAEENETSKINNDFQKNADKTFVLIGNLEIIDYVKVDNNETLASYKRS